MRLFGVACLLSTLISLRPPRRPGWLAMIAFFEAWLVGELPLHTAAAMLGGAGLLVAAGARVDALGAAALALALAGQAWHVVLARRAWSILGVADRTLPWRRLLLVAPLRPPAVERVRDLVYGKVRRQRLDVLRPRDAAPGDARPCFLYVHGGASIIGNKELQGLCTLHALVEAGWVAFSMNYRLSPRATFPDHLDDVRAAIEWIRRHAAEHGGDPSFLVVSGGSAGGHLASLAALAPETRVQGCVSYYGVYDVAERVAPWPHRGTRRFFERVVLKRRFAEAPEAFDAASPLAQVHPGAPPFFLLHGDQDPLVPVAQARAFAERLRAVSRAPAIYAELPGAGHAFEVFTSLRAVAAVRAVVAFCTELDAAKRAERRAAG